ncbi:MAG: hypothetical protein WBN77_09925 [Desulfobacterales bacterium]
MVEEKRKESKEEITVLDEGIDLIDMADAYGMCCWGPLTPFR